ncbi:unnamed protein product [Nesidiocoris tenuis]|uniref:Uncharacterized protein n=1 Tax=Nesidiocoris tenuis TaxID=355587 RepID=A0A6H5H7E7_9HEMI|nr:unnamed protein product [Nesidiocoris tenuis]
MKTVLLCPRKSTLEYDLLYFKPYDSCHHWYTWFLEIIKRISMGSFQESCACAVHSLVGYAPTTVPNLAPRRRKTPIRGGYWQEQRSTCTPWPK